MPTNRRRRRRGLTPQHSAGILGFLLTGSRRGAPAGSRLEIYTKTEADFREAWNDVRDEALVDWVREHAGTRPSAWWKFDAPQPRRRLGGIGDTCAAGFDLGMPRWWTTPALARHSRFVAVDAADPPRFESEAAYLERLGLLPPGEKGRLTPAAFEPKCVLVEEVAGTAR
jgi:hypothetical protein